MSTRESEMKKVSLESAVILSVGEHQDPAAWLCWMGLRSRGFSECGAIVTFPLVWFYCFYCAVLGFVYFFVFLNIYTTQPLNTA